jgi:hypothetical protein
MSGLIDTDADFREASQLLHKLWSRTPSDGSYVKKDWKDLEAAILKLARRSSPSVGTPPARLDADGTAKPLTEIVAVYPDDGNVIGFPHQVIEYKARPTKEQTMPATGENPDLGEIPGNRLDDQEKVERLKLRPELADLGVSSLPSVPRPSDATHRCGFCGLEKNEDAPGGGPALPPCTVGAIHAWDYIYIRQRANEAPWCKGCRQQRTESPNGYCANCDLGDPPRPNEALTKEQKRELRERGRGTPPGEHCGARPTNPGIDVVKTECSGFETERWDDKPIPQDKEIKAYHPTRTGRHEVYADAMALVGAKRSKYALVELVNWLLAKNLELDDRYQEVCAKLEDAAPRTDNPPLTLEDAYPTRIEESSGPLDALQIVSRDRDVWKQRAAQAEVSLRNRDANIRDLQAQLTSQAQRTETARPDLLDILERARYAIHVEHHSTAVDLIDEVIKALETGGET